MTKVEYYDLCRKHNVYIKLDYENLSLEDGEKILISIAKYVDKVASGDLNDKR